MKLKSKAISIASAIASLTALTSQSWAINITTTSDPDTLAGVILGSGVTINSASYTGAAGAAGTFTGGMAAGIGIESGILLTSGAAANVAGTMNTADDIGTENLLDGSAMLNQLIPGYSTKDATLLTLNFVSEGGDIFFNYVFASEEYNEWVGSTYNDVFGFFLDGTSVGNNIALIPGTSTPVSINNVNGVSNSSYYNNNDPSDTFVPYAFEYDGFTDVFTASFYDLAPGSHTITLAIADAGDYILDSGVFIHGGSFSDTPDPVPDGGASSLLLGLALSGLGVVRRLGKRKLAPAE